jgi:hypothetical protein
LTQVPLPAVATLLRAAQTLLGGRCRFQRWRRFYAPLKDIVLFHHLVPSLGTFLLLHHGPSLIYK